jgi:HK97 family phage prohead protease
MSQRETRSISSELRVATSEDGKRTISGLIPYNSNSVDFGGFTEIIAPGAFSTALNRGDVLALRDHDSSLLLGRTKSGTLQLFDSPEGLRYNINLPNTTVANDLAESISRGDLDATSFGFRCIEDNWAATQDGAVVRTLLQVDLIEVSPCSFPAYPESAVDLRSLPVEIRSLIEKRNEPEETPVAAVSEPVIDDELENLKLKTQILSRKN